MPLQGIHRSISFERTLLEGAAEDLDGLDSDVYTRLADTAASQLGFQVERLPDSLRLYTRLAGRPSVFIVSGQHGDERAGPIALLEMLLDDELPYDASIRLCPIVNPIARDSDIREPFGLDANRTWTEGRATPGIAALMDAVRSQPPDVFLDLHESDEKSPKSGKLFELRHAGGPWGRQMLRALGPVVADVGIRTHIRGSAEKYAHELGVPGTAAVETNVQLPLAVRVEFHKQVIRAALGI